MKLRSTSKLLLAAAFGLAAFASVAQAQLVLVNVSQQATFGPFVGGTNNNVTANGSFNTQEVVSTGTPIATPFTITYNPLTGPSAVTLNSGTLNTTTLLFSSPQTPLSYFTSTNLVLNTDFDNNGVIDLTQNYTISLSPFTSGNGLTGVNYTIVPQQSFGNVQINGTSYGYASVVSNNTGTLFDGSSTTAAVQFQFLANPFTPVPEPSTYALAGVLGLTGVVAMRRRFRAASSKQLLLTA
jgi:hypothetical protein